MRTWILALLSLLFTPVPLQGQDLTPHGQITAVRGDRVEVRVNDAYTVSAGVSATIYTKNAVGGVEQTVPVAKMTVQSVSESVATGRVTRQLAGVSPDQGFTVSFSSVDVSPDRTPRRTQLAALELTSTPTGAAVTARPVRATATGRTLYRDEKALGHTPLVDSLMPGRYRLLLEKDGYRAARRRLFVYADSTTRDTVQMMRREGTLVVAAHPDSAVITVDGDERGRGQIQTDVTAGDHTVRVHAPGHYPQQRTVSLDAQQKRSLDIDLDRRLGTLRITSAPDSAQVTISDSTVGRTPVTVERPPGTYGVRITARHYEPSAHRVDLEAEETAAVRAELRRPIEVDLSASHGPGVRNARLKRTGDAIVVRYALRGDADEYDVTLRLSDERGSSYPTRPSAVRGDVGEDVPAGGNQKIRWAVLEDYPLGLIGENYRLRIATDPDGGNAFLYVLGSLLTGGGATAAVLMLKGGGSGGGSSTGGTEGIPPPPSPPD